MMVYYCTYKEEMEYSVLIRCTDMGHHMETYTDDQVIFRTNVEGSGEEKSFLELQTQGFEKMFHIIHRPEKMLVNLAKKIYQLRDFDHVYLTGKSAFMQKGSVLSESSCTNRGDAAFSC